MRTGKKQNVSRHNVKRLGNVQKIFYQKWTRQMARKRFTPEELHARLIVTIGIILAGVFAGSVFSLLYALLFITQPMAQAPNDAQFIDLVSTLSVFLTGTLAGMVSANGLKSKPKPPTEEPEKETK
jgi:ABC-type phosphate/phosphonate transport system permease subunit